MAVPRQADKMARQMEGSVMERKNKVTIAIAMAVVAVLVATSVYAQEQIFGEIAERNRVLRLQGI